MDFFFGRVSGNSLRVAFALEEAAVAYTPHPLNVPAGDGRVAEYLRLNPMGKVPALVDGDVRLWESNAINWYVAEKHPACGLLPATIAGRASMQRWLLFQTGHVSPAAGTIFRTRHPRVRAFWQRPSDDATVAAATAELPRYLAVLERALADREWLEDAFGLADIAYAPHLWLVQGAGYDLGATPNVLAWLDRMRARPAWARAVKLVFDE